jgi:hypothetical protein
VIPVRIPEAGSFQFVRIPGIAETADKDPFFSSLLQAASLNGDKFILFNHQGGDFSIELSSNPPMFWWIRHAMTAAFDHVTLVTPMNGGDWIMVAAGVISLGIVFLKWRNIRKKQKEITINWATSALFISLIVAATLGLYQFIQIPLSDITTKPLALDFAWIAGVFLLNFSGCGLYLMTVKWTDKLFGLTLSVTPALFPGLFSLVMVGGVNLITAQKIGAPIYNYNLVVLPLLAIIPWGSCLWIILHLVHRKTNHIITTAE